MWLISTRKILFMEVPKYLFFLTLRSEIGIPCNHSAEVVVPVSLIMKQMYMLLVAFSRAKELQINYSFYSFSVLNL